MKDKYTETEWSKPFADKTVSVGEFQTSYDEANVISTRLIDGHRKDIPGRLTDMYHKTYNVAGNIVPKEEHIHSTSGAAIYTFYNDAGKIKNKMSLNGWPIQVKHGEQITTHKEGHAIKKNYVHGIPVSDKVAKFLMEKTNIFATENKLQKFQKMEQGLKSPARKN